MSRHISKKEIAMRKAYEIYVRSVKFRIFQRNYSKSINVENHLRFAKRN